jgi:RND family efflux transporter MFP subunit
MKKYILMVTVLSLLGLIYFIGCDRQVDHSGHGAEVEKNHKGDSAGVTYACPMHPDQSSDGPGECSICGMDLVPAEGEKSGGSSVEDDNPGHSSHNEETGQRMATDEILYHCPMHPTYMSDDSGECPICGMTLVPVEAGEGDDSEVEGRASVKVSPEKQQLIGVTFDTVRVSDFSMKVQTVGRLTYDETKIVKVHTRISGWVERLFVDYTGKEVKKGEPLFSLYSPQLYSTQEEYLLALRGEKLLSQSKIEGASANAQSLSKASRKRLKLWDINEEQIERLERTGRSEVNLEIVSPTNGFVIEKNAFEGKYVNPGDILYTIADLEKIWAIADVYEYELPYVEVGQEAKITLSYLPGKEFIGKVAHVYPYLNDNTRTAQVRFEIDNFDFKLKPDMYVNVQIEIDLGKRLMIPKDAILYAGERRIAYVKKDERTFEPKEIKTGVQKNQAVEVLGGLVEGDVVVTSANFLLDSESQLRAAVLSMLGGDHGGHSGH